MISEEDLTKYIMAMIMHAGWVGYQIAAGQTYNLIPVDSQMNSLFDAIEKREGRAELDPKEEHNNWMKFKEKEGWKYGPVKDETAKTHPDLVPWSELPKEEQMKDVQSIAAYLIARAVRTELKGKWRGN